MALSYINRGTNASGSAAVTLASFTAAAGSRLYAFGLGTSDFTSTVIAEPVITATGQAWTRIGAVDNQTSGIRVRMSLYYADIAASASVSVVATATNSGATYIQVIEVTGHNPAAAINFGVGTNTAGDPAATLALAATTGSYVFSWFGGGITGAALTSDADFTEVVDTGTFGRVGLQVRTDAVHSTANWVSTNTRSGSIILEVPLAVVSTPIVLALAAYTFSPQALTTRKDSRLAIDVAAFAASFQPSGLKKATRIPLTVNTYTLAPQALGARATRRLPIAAAAYTLAVNNTRLLKNFKLALNLSTYAVLTNTLSLLKGLRLPATTAAFVFAPFLLGLKKATRVSLAVASYAFVANAVIFKRSLRVAVGTSTYTLSPNAVGTNKATRMPLAVSTYSMAANIALLKKGFRSAAATAVYTLAAQALGTRATRRLPLATSPYSLALINLVTRVTRHLPFTTASYTLIEPSARLLYGVHIPLAPAAYTLSPVAVLIRPSRTILAVRAAYTFAPQVFDARATRRLTQATAVYTVNARPVGLYRNLRAAGNMAPFTLNVNDMRLLHASLTHLESVAFTSVPRPMVMRYGHAILAIPAAYSASFLALNFKRTYRYIASTAPYALTLEDTDLVVPRRLNFNLAQYALSLTNTRLLDARTFPLAASAYTLAPISANLLFGHRLAGNVATYQLSTNAIALSAGKRLSLETVSFSLTQSTINLFLARRLSLDAAAYILSDKAVALLTQHRMVSNASAYTFAANAIGVSHARWLIAAASPYVLSAVAAGLRKTHKPILMNYLPYDVTFVDLNMSIARRRALETLTLALALNDTPMVSARIVRLNGTSFTLSTEPLTLSLMKKLVADAASFVFTANSIIFVSPYIVPGGIRLDHVLYGEIRPNVFFDRIYQNIIEFSPDEGQRR